VLVGSRGGSDKGDRVPVGVPVGFGSRGGNDREIEGSGSKTGSGVTVGIETAGGVLVSYPSSPELHKMTTLQHPKIHTPTIKNEHHSRLKARPLAKAAKAREETITLVNMISKEIGREA